MFATCCRGSQGGERSAPNVDAVLSPLVLQQANDESASHLISHLRADRDSLRARAASRARTANTRDRAESGCGWFQAPSGGTPASTLIARGDAGGVKVLFESSVPSHLITHIDREGLCKRIASRPSVSHLIAHLVAERDLLCARAVRPHNPSRSVSEEAIAAITTLLFSAPPASSSASRFAAVVRGSPGYESRRARSRTPTPVGATSAFATLFGPRRTSAAVIASSAPSHLTAHLTADRARLVGGGGGGSSSDESSTDGSDSAGSSDTEEAENTNAGAVSTMTKIEERRSIESMELRGSRIEIRFDEEYA